MHNWWLFQGSPPETVEGIAFPLHNVCKVDISFLMPGEEDAKDSDLAAAARAISSSSITCRMSVTFLSWQQARRMLRTLMMNLSRLDAGAAANAFAAALGRGTLVIGSSLVLKI